MNLPGRLTRVLDLDPTATAIEFEQQVFPWSFISTMRDELDRQFTAIGLGTGARVAVLLRNRPHHVAAVTALLATQRCIVTINPFSSGAKVSDDIRATLVPVVLADEQDWKVPEIRAAAQAMGARSLLIAPDLKQPLCLLANPEPAMRTELRRTSEGIAIEMLTSGTTGEPKRVALSYRTFQESVEEGLKPDVLSGEPRLKASPAIVYPPLVHVGGMFGVTLAFYEPRPIALLEKFELSKWLELVRRYRPKFASLVPAAIRMILDANVEPEYLRSLLAVRAGTAPLDQATQQAFEDRFGVPVLVTYGATEFAGAVTRWTLDEYKKNRNSKRGSVGRVRPGFELRVVDRATGEVMPPGEIGVLEIRAVRLSCDQWIRTTDLAAVDKDGYLFIHGRADEAIIRGGFKVLPEAVASVFRQHPSVQDAVVVALPDSKLGQVPGLAVEARKGTPRVTEEELRAFARKHLVAYQVPARYLILDELPRSTAMKVRLVEVHQQFNAATS